MQLDVTTVVAIIACVISVGTILWKVASDAATRKAFESHIAEGEQEKKTYRTNYERQVEQQFGAVAGNVTLLREQLAETRENLAKNYMIRAEISEIEKRVTSGQDRIFATLDRIDGRINSLSEQVLKAVNSKAQ